MNTTIQIESYTDDNLRVNIDGRLAISLYPQDYKVKKNGCYYEFDALQAIKKQGYGEDFGLDTQYPGYMMHITKEDNEWIIFAEEHEPDEFPRFKTKREASEYAREWAMFYAYNFIQSTIDDAK